jgi:hypothetical protein
VLVYWADPEERNMPTLKNYSIFISHAWKYDESYYRIESWLNEAANFSWTNLSVPRHDPILNTDQLAKMLHNQMRPADVFVILAGMYVSHSDWIDYEINFARRIGKPIVAIRPWGSTMVPLAVSNGADVIVGWNRDSIVSAIRAWA